MGSFFGGLLAEKGLDVVLIDVWQVSLALFQVIITIVIIIMISTGTCGYDQQIWPQNHWGRWR